MRVPLDVIKTILNFPKLKKYLSENQKSRYEVIRNIDEIHGSFNTSMAQLIKKILNKTFLKLYDHLDLDLPDGFDLKKLKEKYHIVLVPNHQSHADYLALGYLFYERFNEPLYVAAGGNLNIFPIGALFRNMGAFFIRRKFNDDIVYKLSFEAYIYYLIKEQKIIKFFFEGGRSRTGKLLSPRYGLFSTILKVHQSLETKKPLYFIPVAIAHEYLPEEKAHVRELEGGKKVKENSTQLLKIFGIFNKRFGSIHASFQEGIIVDQFDDIKEETQRIAFECFRSVGKGMPVTPSSLLALVLLEEPSGALNWNQIKDRCLETLSYCQNFEVKISDSLDKGEAARSLKRALKNFIQNNKVQVLNEDKVGQEYYFPVKKSRVELLYFKNMILHHFLIPYFIHLARGEVNSQRITLVKDLSRFLLKVRSDLKYEFYLPSTKETFSKSLGILSAATNKKVEDLDDVFGLLKEDSSTFINETKIFSQSFNYIFEAYYLVCLGVEKYKENQEFGVDKLMQKLKAIHKEEIVHGTNIRYLECYIMPVMKNALKFLTHLGHIEADEAAKKYKLLDLKAVNELRIYFKEHLERINELN